MNEDGRHITVAVALDAIALAEHCMGNGNVPVSKDIQRWWRGDHGEGAVMRRDQLIGLAYRLNKGIDHHMAEFLKAKWGDAWDWDVLPELLEIAFTQGWMKDGKVWPDWDAPMKRVEQMIKYEEQSNDRD